MNNEQTPQNLPPTSTPPQPQPVTLESHPHQNLLLPLAALVLLVVSVLVVYTMRKPGSEFTKENVSVVKADLNSANQLSRLPADFPTNTPVETANLTDSLSMHYEDRAAVLYTVTYTSEDTNIRAYARWLTYMEEEGYNIPETGRNMEQWTLYGTKDNNELTLVISSRERGTQVQVSYLARQ